MDRVLILGGARSGKSRRAQLLAEQAGASRLFIATAEPFDQEMQDRVTRHQEERDESWSTLEVPLDLADALRSDTAREANVCLVDCLTVWLSNLMHYDRNVELECNRLCKVVAEHRTPIVMVSNEVGLGLVPDTPLGRQFRDAQGRLNQQVAAVCDTVEFVAAGLPILLKS